MSDYQKYSVYKDSGSDWLGDIPVGWEPVAIKKIAQLKNGRDTVDGEKHQGEYPVYSSAGLFGLTQEYMAEGPSVMFGRKGTIDKPFLVEKGKFWHVDTVFRSEINCSLVIPKMFFYMAQTINYDYLAAGAAVPSMTQTKIHNWKVALPPLKTQQKIVEFLDRETAHIDAGVANMEALITLLSEKRAALISETVTRGIPGEHAEFKDSGVEWLGEVPAEWQISQVKDFFTERRERNDLGQEANYLSLMANRGVIPYAEKGNIGNKMPEDLSKTKKIHNGDFVINSMNYGIGSFGASAYDGVCSNVYVILTPRPEVYNKFAYLLLSNMDVAKYAQSFGKGILAHRCAIGWDVLKGIKMPLPPLETQQKIVDFVDTETSRIDEAISQAKSLIQLMKEKRQTLISEAVTGKIDVTAEVN